MVIYFILENVTLDKTITFLNITELDFNILIIPNKNIDIKTNT